jgi:hypothetical protein
MPGGEAIEAYERGELELGGCVVTDFDFALSCKNCGHKWELIRREIFPDGAFTGTPTSERASVDDD